MKVYIVALVVIGVVSFVAAQKKDPICGLDAEEDNFKQISQSTRRTVCSVMKSAQEVTMRMLSKGIATLAQQDDSESAGKLGEALTKVATAYSATTKWYQRSLVA